MLLWLKNCLSTEWDIVQTRSLSTFISFEEYKCLIIQFRTCDMNYNEHEHEGNKKVHEENM